MASANTNWVKMYYDVKLDRVSNAADFICNHGVRPSSHPQRFIYLGRYQCRQRFPINTNEGVQRQYYNRYVTLLSLEEIENFKKTGKRK